MTSQNKYRNNQYRCTDPRYSFIVERTVPMYDVHTERTYIITYICHVHRELCAQHTHAHCYFGSVGTTGSLRSRELKKCFQEILFARSDRQRLWRDE